MTRLRCGGKYRTSLVVNLLLSPTVKECLKSANISQSYERISSSTFLWLKVYKLRWLQAAAKLKFINYSSYSTHCLHLLAINANRPKIISTSVTDRFINVLWFSVILRLILSQYPLLIGCHLFSPTNHSPHWKSQIAHSDAHSDMHYPVSGINSLILSVSLASHVSTHLLIHLSAHLCYHHHCHHPSLLHSFTSGSKPTFSINPSHHWLLLPTFVNDCLHDNGTGPDLSCSSFYLFLFVPCGGLSWLPVSFLLHVKYTLLCRIVSTGILYCMPTNNKISNDSSYLKSTGESSAP